MCVYGDVLAILTLEQRSSEILTLHFWESTFFNHSKTEFLHCSGCFVQRGPAAERDILVLSLQTVLQGPGPLHQALPGAEESLGAAEELPAAAVSTHDCIAQRCLLQVISQFELDPDKRATWTSFL